MAFKWAHFSPSSGLLALNLGYCIYPQLTGLPNSLVVSSSFPHLCSSPPMHFLHSSQNYLPKRNYIVWLLKPLQLLCIAFGVSRGSCLHLQPHLEFPSSPAVFFRFPYFHCLDPPPPSAKVTHTPSFGFRLNIPPGRFRVPVLFTWCPELPFS